MERREFLKSVTAVAAVGAVAPQELVVEPALVYAPPELAEILRRKTAEIEAILGTPWIIRLKARSLGITTWGASAYQHRQTFLLTPSQRWAKLEIAMMNRAHHELFTPAATQPQGNAV